MCRPKKTAHEWDRQDWIDGKRTASGTVSESVNPATGAVVGQCADGGQAETARPSPAPAAPSMPPLVPGRSLRQRVRSEMADRFDAHAEGLARWSRGERQHDS